MTYDEFINAILAQVHLPRELGASWLGVHTGVPEKSYIEVVLNNGEKWEIHVKRVREGAWKLPNG